jgi:hypothetical protein
MTWERRIIRALEISCFERMGIGEGGWGRGTSGRLRRGCSSGTQSSLLLPRTAQSRHELFGQVALIRLAGPYCLNQMRKAEKCDGGRGRGGVWRGRGAGSDLGCGGEG